MTTRDGIRLRKAGVCWIRYFPGKLAWVLFGLSCLFALCPRAVAKPPLHAEVLVFVPAYEASQLFETDRIDNGQRATSCVWGNYNVFLSSTRYFALRMPNPLVAKPMLRVGPIDVYQRLISTLTEMPDSASHFAPYTLGSDFFIFAYDWRQEIASQTAPLLGRALETYAAIHEGKTGIPARETRFIIITHSMGGLVARTLLSEQPQWADRISRLYLVGTPNTGSVKAINTLIIGPDTIKGQASGFPGVLLNIIPTNVDQNVTKLVGITRPSLYELLPFDDPHWRIRRANGALVSVGRDGVLAPKTWEEYWPSAALEKTLFLDGWLQERRKNSSQIINPGEWEYCQDSRYPKLKRLLAKTREWRHAMGRVSRTAKALSRPGEATRLRIVLSTGVPTPTGIITEGSHDSSQATFTFDPSYPGDGTVEEVRVLDDIDPQSSFVRRLRGVTHQRLMIDPQFLSYITNDLSR